MDCGQLFNVFLKFGFSAYDVGTDTLNGIEFLTPHTMLYSNYSESEEIPSNCDRRNDSQVECIEQDFVWGVLTLSCIQLPGVVMFICSFVALLIYPEHFRTNLCKLILLLVVPFPLIIWFQQLWSICHPSPFMEQFSAILLLGEGSLESSPQLILQNYIILTNSSRVMSTIQLLAIIGSYFTIAKTSIEMYASESGNWSEFNDIFNYEETYKDSMLEDKPFLKKLWVQLQISPAFLTSLVFKVKCFSN